RDGALSLALERRGGATVLSRCRYSLPLQVLAPLALDDRAAVVSVLNPTGGLVGGDRLAIDVVVGPAAHACLTTPSATQVYGAGGGGGPRIRRGSSVFRLVRGGRRLGAPRLRRRGRAGAAGHGWRSRRRGGARPSRRGRPLPRRERARAHGGARGALGCLAPRAPRASCARAAEGMIHFAIILCSA